MKKVMVLMAVSAIMMMSFTGVALGAQSYQETVAGWESYKDVANWLEKNFRFDKDRQKTIGKRLKSQGPSGLLVRSPETFFENSQGYCADSANFAMQSLNEIDLEYNPQWVFIKNSQGRPNHWVIGFNYEGKLYIMDYGTGDKWRAMQGVHGPYDSLDEYAAFLESLDIPGFGVDRVWFRNMPGQVD